MRLRGLAPENLGFFCSLPHALGGQIGPADRAFPSAETVLGSPALGAVGAPIGKQNQGYETGLGFQSAFFSPRPLCCRINGAH